MNPCGFAFSVFLPCLRKEENYYREELKSSANHIKRKDEFRETGVCREIAGRTDLSKAGTYIIECCGNSRKIRLKAEIVKRDKDERHDVDKQIAYHI